MVPSQSTEHHQASVAKVSTDGRLTPSCTSTVLRGQGKCWGIGVEQLWRWLHQESNTLCKPDKCPPVTKWYEDEPRETQVYTETEVCVCVCVIKWIFTRNKSQSFPAVTSPVVVVFSCQSVSQSASRLVSESVGWSVSQSVSHMHMSVPHWSLP